MEYFYCSGGSGKAKEGEIMYLRLKKILILVILLVLCMVVSSATVFAAGDVLSTSDDKFLNEVEKTNEFIEKAIDDACEKAERMVANITASNQNQKEEKIEAAIDSIITQLIKRTDHKVAMLIKKANSAGVEIVSEFIEVIIYNRTVIVDPCYAH
ncbi:MAG: hypothetical protein EOM59_02950 [Clostridia bacterium]|nr:hypothetical protein [Clostridia bacterium]